MPNCNGLLHLISLPPPGWRLTFSSYPWRLTKIAFTPEDFRKIWAYRWRIWVLAPKNLVLALKNFAKIKASPPNNYVFFYSTPKEILNFYNLPLENSMVPHPGWGWGGGMRILNAIAQSDSIFFKFVHPCFFLNMLSVLFIYPPCSFNVFSGYSEVSHSIWWQFTLSEFW